MTLLEDEIYKGFLQKTHWYSRIQKRNILVMFQPRITKFSEKDVNHDIIIDMQSWCKTWPPNGSSRIRAKQKLLRKRKGACKGSWSRPANQKSFTLTTSLEFGKYCEDLSWNHCTSTPHKSETSGIAERAVRRVKRKNICGTVAIGLDNEWWADSMECYCYLRKH